MKKIALLSTLMFLPMAPAAASDGFIDKIDFLIEIGGKHHETTPEGGYRRMEKGRFFRGTAIVDFHDQKLTLDPNGPRHLVFYSKSCEGYYSVSDHGSQRGIEAIEGGGGMTTADVYITTQGETANCYVTLSIDTETNTANIVMNPGIDRVAVTEKVNGREYDAYVNWRDWSSFRGEFEVRGHRIEVEEGSDYEHVGEYNAKGTWPQALEGLSLRPGETVETNTRLRWKLYYEKKPEQAPEKKPPVKRPKPVEVTDAVIIDVAPDSPQTDSTTPPVAVSERQGSVITTLPSGNAPRRAEEPKDNPLEFCMAKAGPAPDPVKIMDCIGEQTGGK